MLTIQIIFWTLLISFIYVYILYPIGLWVTYKALKSFIGRKQKRTTLNTYPKISVVIPCSNEMEILAKKLKNCRKLRYPSNQIEFIFVNDASEDGSKKWFKKNLGNNNQFKTINKLKRCGKFEAQKTGSCYAQGEIIVFSDCSAMLNPNAILRMSKHFRDDKIGAVSGVYKAINTQSTSRAKGEGAYWKYEMGIRRFESKLQTITHATGALYAIRDSIAKDCFLNNTQTIVNDDLFLPLWSLEMGYSVKSEPQAIASEYVDTEPGKDFDRRIRIAKGNLALWKETFILIQKHRYFAAFQFLSHKLLRNFQGTFIFPLFLMNIVILFFTNNPIYIVILALQIIFYSLAAMGTHKFKSNKLNKMVSIPYYFTLANIAGARATFSLIFVKNSESSHLWEKADVNLDSREIK